ncbi:MAG: LacI family DNA-binding transcriptional regulator [Lachnospiraceae bacterium]|nr:LacI family DNA-binding transcriptional regulator [Lachnospiraceae bacterium]
MATIREIAFMAGVSSTTVSRVLNYDETISVNDDTRARIFNIAKELGYSKKIINPLIENVAFLYWIENEEKLEDEYFKAIYDEIKEQARARNIKLKVYYRRDGINAIEEGTSAFLAIGWFDRKELDYLRSKIKTGVFIDSSPDEKYFDAVRPNLDSMVTQIVDYFILKGHRSIGFFGGHDKNIDTGDKVMDVREWSFRESMKYYGFLCENYIFLSDEFTVKDGYKTAKRAIAEYGENLPTAFCIASDTLAIGILQAFNEANIAIPARVAFYSINNISIVRYVSPPLTTFHIDVPLLCESAIDLLAERILKDRDITKTVFINGSPFFRKSC